MPRYSVKLEDGNYQLKAFTLALDDKGYPLYTSHLLEPVHISQYSQSEEARYANLLPGVGSVYAQDNLAGGLGKKSQVVHEHPLSDHYYYAEWFDASVKGQGQKGPKVTTLTAPANSGTLSGYFQLAGVPYLVLGRRIVTWTPVDNINAVHDYGAGIAGGQAAVFSALGAEASVESNLTQTTTSTLASLDDRLAQSFRLSGTGVRFLGSVAHRCMLRALGVTRPLRTLCVVQQFGALIDYIHGLQVFLYTPKWGGVLPLYQEAVGGLWGEHLGADERPAGKDQ